jgi:two-component system sensor histidine kinase/response regulator
MKQTILLVDDDESFQGIAQAILESNGYDVRTANNVDEAERMLSSFTPEVIISDVEMPGKTGFDFFTHVQSLPLLQNIPFVFLTANSDINSVTIGKELGSDDYLTKPVNYNLLLATVKGKLKKKDLLNLNQTNQIDQIKDQLFHMISHEMRTPLTCIVGAAEILAEPQSNFSAKDLTAMLEMLQNNSRRLTSMFDDFLLVTRIEAGDILKEIDHQEYLCNPNKTVENVLRLLRQKINDKHIDVQTMVVSKEISTRAHIPHVENILYRFIDNAIKFSKKNMKVTVSYSEDEVSFTFSINDEGCGIPIDQRSFIFEKLQQLNREKNEQQGSGLGLYIAKKFAEANNGKTWFESVEKKGSTFFAMFPK